MPNGETKTTLGAELQGARIIMYDERADLTLAWFGGHGIHAYDQNGSELIYWNVGDFAKDNADQRTVRASMKRRISRREAY